MKSQRNLPPTFTWKEYLDWAEEISPDATFEDCQRLFDTCAAHGLIRPEYINEADEFVYKLHANWTALAQVEVVFVRKEKQ